MSDQPKSPETIQPQAPASEVPATPAVPAKPQISPKEYGGPKGPEPTRFGDWEKNGRCIDF